MVVLMSILFGVDIATFVVVVADVVVDEDNGKIILDSGCLILMNESFFSSSSLSSFSSELSLWKSSSSTYTHTHSTAHNKYTSIM